MDEARKIVKLRLNDLDSIINQLSNGSKEFDEILLKSCKDEDFAFDFCANGGHVALRSRFFAGDEAAAAIITATAHHGISFPASITREQRKAPERIFVHDSLELWIRFVQNRQREQADTGYIVWPAALILARWFYLNPDFIHDKQVIELGSGVGVTGLACLDLKPKSLILSDANHECLRNLAYNLQLNFSLERHSRTSIDFLDFYHVHDTHFERIIASDIVCCIDDAKALARFLASCLLPNYGKAAILLADSRNRWGVEAFPSALASFSPSIKFSVTKLPPPAQKEEYCIKLFESLFVGLDDERQYLKWTLFLIERSPL
mmetsp:Transcript_14152/g.21403  ORF Transcript_14152/g.21403 Transcript_14152/m.21403 type:complete len:319 (-) Transcript_14152:1390-2346(-)|eukprot:CAMPEP_0197317394 /NCGR_PEP_ID=MMETSP0891-20130614/46862_1 /TAXON_ID=44058 ORGANISM="Aureoumbra lagunensis, Strain CCMP1510" /NCGR_SAMPLE_ID=MMETSP0891 /ASSEMBLY_ACC=CAM_ASM_000534 /LENGTH=318 /DNA_ID=CAMNT_0042807375 /DNA_START=48 /DNA_END=1004 /DNA_ORIENTATION=-